jgi:ABC-type branched-subunit amino acid transport system ATPase component
MNISFFFEVLIGGLLSGVMYALVAIGFVLIEHDMGVVMDISDRVVVLDYGRKIGDGTPDEVRANPEVISAYLGVAHGH